MGSHRKKTASANTVKSTNMTTDFDPSLTALFATSLKPTTKSRTQDSSTTQKLPVVNSIGHASDLNGIAGETRGGDKRGNEIITREDAGPGTTNSSEGNERSEASRRKRKRNNRNDHDVEGAYMLKLEQDESRENNKRQITEDGKRRKLKDHIKEDSNASKGEQSDPTSDADPDDIAMDIEKPQPVDGIPEHESLAKTEQEDDLEKAARTVFLANVSTLAIKSKSSKKLFLDHLASFFPLLPVRDQVHKIESLRFRSTPFSSSAVPKRAAYAKKELMDATAKSTNAYAVYSTQAAAREAVQRLNGTVVLDRHLRVDGVAHPAKTDHRRCVFVGNLGFVDDETAMNAAKDEEHQKKPRKAREPADIEEGLWRQFSKAGTVESVRVVRDKATRVGKGIAYVQFEDANAVEKALSYNEKKFPPMLPRILRVTRAKNIRKTASHVESTRASDKRSRPSETQPIHRSKPSSQIQSLSGRAGKLLGRAGAARFKGVGKTRGKLNGKLEGIAKTPEKVIFEGYRASNRELKARNSSKGSDKKHGKPRTRSSKRGAAFKASGGKKAHS